MSYALRPFQIQAIKSLQKPIHLVCVSPTGSGKSAIYEQYLKSNTSRCLLVSPLIALGRQQWKSLNQLGIKSSLGMGPDSEYPSDSRVWIVSPEKIFTNPRAIQFLKRWKPEFLVVDECHTLFEWGNSFRPLMNQVPSLLQTLAIQRSLWMTATLSTRQITDLQHRIRYRSETQVNHDLPHLLELKFFNLPFEQRLGFLAQWVRITAHQPGIIFVRSRVLADRIGRVLQNTHACRVYHAGLSNEERVNIEQEVRINKTQFVIATSAFGMGMDFPHLRSALFMQPPYSLLSLAQGLGRVTRGSFAANSAVLWSDSELNSPEPLPELKQVFKSSFPPKIALRRALEFENTPCISIPAP